MSDLYVVAALSAKHVRLEPLTLEHVSELAAAASEERISYDFTVVPDTPRSTRRYVVELLEQFRAGKTIPFAQVDPTTGRAFGVTRYLSLRVRAPSESPFAVEIGGTWLAASRQRTPANTEAKVLLVDYAFSSWRCRRVDFKTDERNARSRAAILRLGATFEGVLRGWQPSQFVGEQDRYRDTAMYSILDDEWPDARATLVARLNSHGPSPSAT